MDMLSYLKFRERVLKAQLASLENKYRAEVAGYPTHSPLPRFVEFKLDLLLLIKDPIQQELMETLVEIKKLEAPDGSH